MNRLFICVVLLIAPLVATAGNIAVIDASADEAHLSSISNRLLFKGCYSSQDDSALEPPNVGSPPSVSNYQLYKVASGCPNGLVTDTKIGSREVIEYYRTGASPKLRTLSDDHMSHVIHAALKQSDQDIVAISTNHYFSESGLFVAPSRLRMFLSDEGIERALDYVLLNHAALNIKVINMSYGGDFYDGVGNCDSELFNTVDTRIIQKINRLYQLGIVMVAAAGNEIPQGFTSGMQFPACLSNVISVGGLTSYNGRFIYAGTSRYYKSEHRLYR